MSDQGSLSKYDPASFSTPIRNDPNPISSPAPVGYIPSIHQSIVHSETQETSGFNDSVPISLLSPITRIPNPATLPPPVRNNTYIS